MQRVANIFGKLGPLAMKCQVRESRLIRSMKMKENQLGQVSLRWIRSIAVNRGQTRLNQAFGSKPNARQLADGGRARVPSRRSTVGGDLKRANLTHFDLVVNNSTTNRRGSGGGIVGYGSPGTGSRFSGSGVEEIGQ